MSKKILFNGTEYLGSKEAGKSVGYSYDYVSRLARQGVVKAEKVGTSWFVDPKSLEGFAKNQKINTAVRSKQLSRQVSNAMSTTNKVGGLTNAQAALSNPSASSMASAIKTASPTDNSLRMESIAKGGMMRAFGAGSSGMLAGSLSPSMSGLGAGMSAVGMANKLTALVTATSLVFGLYALTDKQYARFAQVQVDDALESLLVVARNAPAHVLSITQAFGTGFNALAQKTDLYTAHAMLGASSLAGTVFERLAIQTTLSTDALLSRLTSALTTSTNLAFNSVVHIGIQELPLVERELRSQVATRDFARIYNAELTESKKVVSGGGEQEVIKTTVPIRATQGTTIVVKEVETRRETVREVVPMAVMRDLVAEALAGTAVIDEVSLRNSLRTELLGLIPTRSSASRVSTRGALSLTQRIDQLGGVDFSNGTIVGTTITNAPISGSSGSFTTLSASGATSLSTLTASDLTLSGNLSVAGTTTLATATASGLITGSAGLTISVGDVTLPANTIDSTEITDRTIVAIDIATSAITANELGVDSVGASELAPSGVAAGIYGATTIVPIVTVDEDGRITTVATTTITVIKDSITDSGTLAFDWADSEVADNLTISAGTIEGTPIGSVTPSTAAFTNTTSGNLTLTNLANGTTTDVVLVRDASNVVKVISMNDVGRTTFAGLDDTTLAALADADMIIYDADTGMWRNKAISGAFTLDDEGVATITPDSIGDTQLTFNTGQHLTTASSPTFAGQTINGNVTITGTVDGRDISTDGAALDTVAANNSVDVTLAGALNYLTIVGQVITRNAIDLATDVTGILGLAFGGTGSSTAAGARTNLGVDAAGTDNSTNVTLAGTGTYVSLTGQVLTIDPITESDISDLTHTVDTNTTYSAGTGLTLTGTTFSNDLGVSIDISSETNLSGNAEIVLTGDALSIASSIARDSELHSVATVSDSSELNLTITGQDITAALIAGSIDETKLDASTNASLNLADSALQSSDIGVSVQSYNANTSLLGSSIESSEITDNTITASDLFVTGNGTAGQVLTSDADGSFSWTTKTTDTNTTYTAGTGLTLTGTTFSNDLGTSIESSEIIDDTITNADINSAAAIAYSKLNLTGAIQDTDLASTFLKNIVEDTTPQLGGNLDANGFTIGAIDNLSDAQKDTGNNNLFLGHAGFAGTFYNNFNTALGLYAFDNPNTDNTQSYYGDNNTAIGFNALSNNTTGSSNSAQGRNTLFSNTTGSNNSAQGSYALYSNTTGSSNSAQGRNTLYSNTTGSNNSAQGVNSGRYIADGSTANTVTNQSIFLGAYTKAQADNQTNQIVIGYNAIGNGSNTVTLGNDSISKTILKGNVGIGTTAPGAKLEVNSGNNATDSVLRISVPSTATADPVLDFYGAGAYGFRMGLDISDGGTLKFDAGNGAIGSGSTRMAIKYNGNVGIGTTSPSNLLHIDTNAWDKGIRLERTRGGIGGPRDISIGIAGVDGHALGFSSHGGATNGYDMVIRESGNVGIGTTAPVAQLHISKAGTSTLILSDTTNSVDLQLRSDSSGGWLRTITNNKLYLGANYGTHVTINTSGNVGIGTTGPADKLDVSGDIRVGTGTTGCVKDADGTVIAGTCSSDERLKTNIEDITGVLDGFADLRIVNYKWNELASDIYTYGTEANQIGALAQNVESIFPELVVTDNQGYKQVNYTGLQLYAFTALKELDLKIEDLIASSTASVITEEDGFVERIVNIVTDWFDGMGVAFSENMARFSNLAAAAFTVGSAQAPSGITLYDKETNEPYCLEISGGEMEQTAGTCEEVAQAEAQASAPTLTLMGNNPAELAVGVSYSDLGVIAQNAGGNDISYTVSIDGTELPSGSTVTVDTSANATFEITYTAISGGETVSVTRTVIVGTGVAEENEGFVFEIALNGDAAIDVAVGSAYEDLGAIALDADGNAVGIDILLNGTSTDDINVDLDTSVVAAHAIDYRAEFDGEAVTVTRTVSVVEATPEVDETAPVITLVGNEIVEVVVGEDYVDAGVTITDNTDENPTLSVDVDGVIVEEVVLDTLEVTSYSITYIATDASGNVANVVRTVNVVAVPEPEPDTIAPEITLTGDAEITLTVGDAYDEQGATAADETDGDITGQIETSGTVDTDTVGTYIITYTANDAAGNEAQETRVILVQATQDVE